MEIIELTSFEDLLTQFNTYLDSGMLFSEERLYFLEGDGTQGIVGDNESGYKESKQINIFYELGGYFSPTVFFDVDLQELMNFLVSKFEEIDASSFYTYTENNGTFTLFCNNSYFLIKPCLDWGVVQISNQSGLSFDSEQKDLSIKENQNNKNIKNLGNFISEFLSKEN